MTDLTPAVSSSSSSPVIPLPPASSIQQVTRTALYHIRQWGALFIDATLYPYRVITTIYALPVVVDYTKYFLTVGGLALNLGIVGKVVDTVKGVFDFVAGAIHLSSSAMGVVSLVINIIQIPFTVKDLSRSMQLRRFASWVVEIQKLELPSCNIHEKSWAETKQKLENLKKQIEKLKNSREAAFKEELFTPLLRTLGNLPSALRDDNVENFSAANLVELSQQLITLKEEVLFLALEIFDQRFFLADDTVPDDRKKEVELSKLRLLANSMNNVVTDHVRKQMKGTFVRGDRSKVEEFGLRHLYQCKGQFPVEGANSIKTQKMNEARKCFEIVKEQSLKYMVIHVVSLIAIGFSIVATVGFMMNPYLAAPILAFILVSAFLNVSIFIYRRGCAIHEGHRFSLGHFLPHWFTRLSYTTAHKLAPKLFGAEVNEWEPTVSPAWSLPPDWKRNKWERDASYYYGPSILDLVKRITSHVTYLSGVGIALGNMSRCVNEVGSVINGSIIGMGLTAILSNLFYLPFVIHDIRRTRKLSRFVNAALDCQRLRPEDLNKETLTALKAKIDPLLLSNPLLRNKISHPYNQALIAALETAYNQLMEEVQKEEPTDTANKLRVFKEAALKVTVEHLDNDYFINPPEENKEDDLILDHRDKAVRKGKFTALMASLGESAAYYVKRELKGRGVYAKEPHEEMALRNIYRDYTHEQAWLNENNRKALSERAIKLLEIMKGQTSKQMVIHTLSVVAITLAVAGGIVLFVNPFTAPAVIALMTLSTLTYLAIFLYRRGVVEHSEKRFSFQHVLPNWLSMSIWKRSPTFLPPSQSTLNTPPPAPA